MKNALALIVNSPVTSPAIPSWNSAVVAGSFLGSNLSCFQYDANLDFFLNHVLSKNKLHHYQTVIKKKNVAKFISKTEFKAIEKACERISKSSISIDCLRTGEFYEPEKFLLVKNHINDLLLCFSSAFFPSVTGWGSFFLKTDHFVEDPNINPFVLLCKQGLKDKIDRVDPDVVVLLISSLDQLFAGKTMGWFIKSNFPGKKVVVIHDPHIPVRHCQFFDHIFSIAFLDPFFNLLHTLGKGTITSDTRQPDFNRLLLKDYLTPDTVLPVNPSFFKDKKSFWTFLSHQQDSLDVKGFILEGHYPGIENLLENESSDLFFSVSKSMDDIDGSDKSGNQHVHCPSCFKMVCWDSPQKETLFKTQTLWDLSKLGVWNHVKIFGKTRITLRKDLFSFIASNPNIAHSFENQDGKNSFNQSGKFRIDPEFQSYAKVEQLPGEPFWKILQDPVYLLLYLNKYGKKDLFSIRADPREQSVITLGSRILFEFKKPDDLDGKFLDEICRMVEAGGSVDTKYVRYNLERAYLIGYAMENGVIVGNSSLKHPRKEFIERINQIIGMDFTHFLERGYTSVRPEYRALGVGAKLLEGLTARAGEHKVFSVISEDNTATQKIALRNKTRKIAAYYSEKVGKELGVWMPEQMIEDNWNLKK
ncbi:MAG: hypothetical protein KKE44_17245 [Proteobacteria bacterium]|nr:hypothetical protein [Pseudomonadota bacterium]MBU1584477.1 hypothetical protein [Pseudomonadota bacterium]MBU2455264.1 hypothetical protein [Pseudomonadota bacterium]MBU2629850.1 hypothetical protein [Pseudomonadota bacterium]